MLPALRNMLLIILLLTSVKSTAFNLTRCLRGDSRIEKVPLYTDEEFSALTATEAFKESTPNLTQEMISRRDYQHCKTTEEFQRLSQRNLEQSTNFLLMQRSKARQVTPVIVDTKTICPAHCETNDLTDFAINYSFYSLQSIAIDKYGSNEDKAFLGFINLKLANGKKIKAYFSVLSDNHSMERYNKIRPSAPQAYAVDCIQKHFISTIKSVFKSYVDINKEHTIQKALVYTFTTLSRKITSSRTFDNQGSTLNLILILPMPDNSLRLFLANAGDTLCFLFNSQGLKDYYQKAGIAIDELKNNIFKTECPDFIDLLTNQVSLLNRPHNQLPPFEYARINFNPFGGLKATKRGEVIGLTSVFYKNNPVGNYRCLGDKKHAPAISPNPDVISIPLKPGDCLIQVTDPIPPAQWAQHIQQTLNNTEEKFCATKLAIQGGCQYDDSTAVITFIKNKEAKEQNTKLSFF